MLRMLAAGICLLACASTVAAVPLPLVHLDFETNTANQGTGGAAYNPTVIGAPQAGWNGGPEGAFQRPGGVVGAGLNLTPSNGNDALSLPAGTAALGQSFTISAWHYLNPTAPGTSRYYVFEGSNNHDVSYGTTANATSTSFISYVGSGASGTTTNLANNAWHHVLHSFASDGANTTLSVYINGSLRHTLTASTASMNFSGINIGNARTGQSRYWDGVLDEVSVWNSALSPADAAQVYQQGTLGMGFAQAHSQRILGMPLDPNINITANGWVENTFANNAGPNNDLGDAGFEDSFYRTTGAGDKTLSVQFTNLDPHTHVNLGMLLAQLDSLDPVRDGDRFLVKIDGQTILDAGFGYGVSGSLSQPIVTTGDPALDAELLALRTASNVHLFMDGNFRENVYDLGQLSLFQMIPHTSSSLLLEIIGRQNQSAGEFYGLDNLTLSTMLVPEPGSLVLLGLGGLLLAGGVRFGRPQTGRARRG